MMRHKLNMRQGLLVAVLAATIIQPTLTSAVNCGETVCENFTNQQGWQYKCCVPAGLVASGCREYRRAQVTCPSGATDYLYELIANKPGMDCEPDLGSWTGTCIDPEPPGGGS